MSETTTYLDCDARLRAITPPELTLGGIRYRGQLLSIVEWLPYLEKLEALEQRQKAHADAIAKNRALDEQQDLRPRVTVPPAPALRDWVTLYQQFLRAVFPRALRPHWWMRGFGRTYDPVARLERAPDPALLGEAFAVFFGRHLRAMQRKSEPLEVETSDHEAASSTSPASDSISTTPKTPAGSSSPGAATEPSDAALLLATSE